MVLVHAAQAITTQKPYVQASYCLHECRQIIAVVVVNSLMWVVCGTSARGMCHGDFMYSLDVTMEV